MRPPPVPILNRVNPLHTLTQHFLYHPTNYAQVFRGVFSLHVFQPESQMKKPEHVTPLYETKEQAKLTQTGGDTSQSSRWQLSQFPVRKMQKVLGINTAFAFHSKLLLVYKLGRNIQINDPVLCKILNTKTKYTENIKTLLHSKVHICNLERFMLSPCSEFQTSDTDAHGQW